MPIYEYECLTCGTIFEKRQSFSEPAKADCPNGHSETRRLISSPAIVFKGSGFYINDSRNGTNGNGKLKKSDSSSETKSESSSESKSETKSESKSETKAESKPEKTETTSASS
jgi:putative FmdB family regulatory protein